MRFGHFSHVWNKPRMAVADRYDQLWRELALCDELGFDYGFAVEHHFRPYESWMPSPAAYCAGAAAHTRRLRLGPMGYIVPLYDPLRIAEEAAVLDNMLRGRLELGLVSGITPIYFSHYQADFAGRRQRTHEALQFLKTAFTSDHPFSYEGPFHRYQDVTLNVRPLQRPHPPFWIQSRDPDTLALLAQEGGIRAISSSCRARTSRRATASTSRAGSRPARRASRTSATGPSSTWTRRMSSPWSGQRPTWSMLSARCSASVMRAA